MLALIWPTWTHKANYSSPYETWGKRLSIGHCVGANWFILAFGSCSGLTLVDLKYVFSGNRDFTPDHLHEVMSSSYQVFPAEPRQQSTHTAVPLIVTSHKLSCPSLHCIQFISICCFMFQITAEYPSPAQISVV